MRSKLYMLLVGLVLAAVLAPSRGRAQDTEAEAGSTGWGVTLPVSGWGLAVGHVDRVTGIRLNFADRSLERVNGLTVTFWKPGDDVGGSINGLAAGVWGPKAGHLRGVSLGPLISAERSAWGLNLAGLTLLSGGAVNGLNVGGLGTVVRGGANGLNLSGLAMLSQWEATGINVAGLAVLTFGRARWLNVGGLGVVGSGGAEGVTIGGLASISQLWMRGINVGGLAVVGTEEISGISVAGAAILAGNGKVRGLAVTPGLMQGRRSVSGVVVGGYRIQTRTLTGVSVGGWVDAEELRGLSVGVYHGLEAQRGLTVGLFNSAEELRGVQVGVLNYAGNNPPAFRWLPLLNLHF